MSRPWKMACVSALCLVVALQGFRLFSAHQAVAVLAEASRSVSEQANALRDDPASENEPAKPQSAPSRENLNKQVDESRGEEGLAYPPTPEELAAANEQLSKEQQQVDSLGGSLISQRDGWNQRKAEWKAAGDTLKAAAATMNGTWKEIVVKEEALQSAEQKAVAAVVASAISAKAEDQAKAGEKKEAAPQPAAAPAAASAAAPAPAPNPPAAAPAPNPASAAPAPAAPPAPAAAPAPVPLDPAVTALQKEVSDLRARYAKEREAFDQACRAARSAEGKLAKAALDFQQVQERLSHAVAGRDLAQEHLRQRQECDSRFLKRYPGLTAAAPAVAAPKPQ